jgi:hypothetical protein
MTALGDLFAVLKATITGKDPIDVLLKRYHGRVS